MKIYFDSIIYILALALAVALAPIQVQHTTLFMYSAYLYIDFNSMFFRHICILCNIYIRVIHTGYTPQITNHTEQHFALAAELW